MKLIIFFLSFPVCLYSAPNLNLTKPVNVEHYLEKMILEIAQIDDLYAEKIDSINNEILKHEQLEFQENQCENLFNRVAIIELKLKKQVLYDDKELQIAKIKYINGIDIIRILYEKILSLDHHFSSVATLQEINQLANPNQYAEWNDMVEIIRSEVEEDKQVHLGNILGNNPIISVINTFGNLFNSNLDNEEKKIILNNIECVIDFTTSMNDDLNTIYFETNYLQANNRNIQQSIHEVFEQYTKPINYNVSLSKCRNNDDWSELNRYLNMFLRDINNKDDEKKKRRMKINLDFSVQRLMNFIDIYNDFIANGEFFYEKFRTMLNGYDNKAMCATKLPVEYEQLRKDVEIATNKFRIAYKPIEINGSKLKQILYGINEYE